MRKPVLILTVGLPRCGKSTWARAQGLPVVNPDSIRLAIHGQRYLASAEQLVWAHAKIMVRSLFLAGAPIVILDATNTLVYRRELWNDDAWDVVYHEVPTDKDECIRRARAEDDEYIVPVIEKMAAEFEPLDPSLPRYVPAHTDNAAGQRAALVAKLCALFGWGDTSWLHAILHVDHAVLNERADRVADNHVNQLEIPDLRRRVEFEKEFRTRLCESLGLSEYKTNDELVDMITHSIVTLKAENARLEDQLFWTALHGGN